MADIEDRTASFEAQLDHPGDGPSGAREAADLYQRCVREGRLVDHSQLSDAIRVRENLLGVGGFGAVFEARVSPDAVDRDTLLLDLLRQHLAEEERVNLAACHEPAFTRRVSEHLETLDRKAKTTLLERSFEATGFRWDRFVVKISWETLKESGGRLRQEMKTAGIAHPHLGCPIFSGLTTNRRVYHVLPFYDALLPSDQAHASFGLDQVGRVALQLARALHYLEEREIVHRDVKPENVIYARRNGQLRAVLLDLGIAKLAEGNQTASFRTREGTGLGSYDYMSPEQAVDASRCDVRTDVFGFGGVLYNLFTGEDTNPVPNERDLLARLANARERRHLPVDPVRWTRLEGTFDRWTERSWIPGLSWLRRRRLARRLQNWRLLLAICLQKKMEDRYPGFGPLIDDLERLRKGRSPVHARRLAAEAGGPNGRIQAAFRPGLAFDRSQPTLRAHTLRAFGCGVLATLTTVAALGAVVAYRQPIGDFLDRTLPPAGNAFHQIEQTITSWLK